jgi:hypothetical protein
MKPPFAQRFSVAHQSLEAAQTSKRQHLDILDDGLLRGPAVQIDSLPHLATILVQNHLPNDVLGLDLHRDPRYISQRPIEDPEHNPLDGQLEAGGEGKPVDEDVNWMDDDAVSGLRSSVCCLWSAVMVAGSDYVTVSKLMLCVARLNVSSSSSSGSNPYSTSPALVGPDDSSGSCWTM